MLAAVGSFLDARHQGGRWLVRIAEKFGSGVPFQQLPHIPEDSAKWPNTRFYGDDTGSNLVGDANKTNKLRCDCCLLSPFISKMYPKAG